MQRATGFLGAGAIFASRASFEFLNRLSQAVPNCGLGLTLLPTALIGWAILWLCGFGAQHLVLGGCAAMMVGPAAVWAAYFVIGMLLSAVPQAAVVPVCAKSSVTDSIARCKLTSSRQR